MSVTLFLHKYLKYKNKYITLKNQLGKGACFSGMCDSIDDPLQVRLLEKYDNYEYKYTISTANDDLKIENISDEDALPIGKIIYSKLDNFLNNNESNKYNRSKETFNTAHPALANLYPKEGFTPAEIKGYTELYNNDKGQIYLGRQSYLVLRNLIEDISLDDLYLFLSWITHRLQEGAPNPIGSECKNSPIVE